MKFESSQQGFYDSTIIMALSMIGLCLENEKIIPIIDEGLLMGIKDTNNTLQFIIIKLSGFVVYQLYIFLRRNVCRPFATEATVEKNYPKIMYDADLFRSQESPTVSCPINRVKSPISISEWMRLKKLGEPFIIEDLLTDWPALSKWNFEYFLKIMGERTVPIEIGEKYTDENWGQQLMKFELFLENIILNKPDEKSYLAQHPLLEQIPQLEDDIIIPGQQSFVWSSNLFNPN